MTDQSEIMDIDINTTDTNKITETTKSDKTELYETIGIIAKQAGIDDLLLAEKSYYECKGDVSKAILSLMNITVSLQRHEKEEKEKTVFDDIREIMDEKEALFHAAFNKST